MIKTFRGLLADGGQDRIRLSTIKGKVGYRIIKFQIMTNTPGITTPEVVVKVYKTEQTTIDGAVDLTAQSLLGVAFESTSTGAAYGLLEATIIFDNEIFNQDIFVTAKDVSAQTNKTNYYLELEAIPLVDKAAEYTTIKDIRTATSTI